MLFEVEVGMTLERGIIIVTKRSGCGTPHSIDSPICAVRKIERGQNLLKVPTGKIPSDERKILFHEHGFHGRRRKELIQGHAIPSTSARHGIGTIVDFWYACGSAKTRQQTDVVFQI
jgi:hypothetical protein